MYLVKHIAGAWVITIYFTEKMSSTSNPVMVTIGVSTSQDASFLKKLSKYNEKVLKHNAHVAHYPIIYAKHVLP